MGMLAATALFLGSLIVTLAAARMFARRLDRLGTRFGFPEALVGLLTALAADGPEISSALFALVKGAHSLSVGVLVGSNAFNLAAMIGVTGVVTGAVRLPRETLALDGTVAAGATAIGAAVLLRWIAPTVGAILGACLLAPYLAAVIGGSELLAHGSPLRRLASPLARTLAQRPRHDPAVPASDEPGAPAADDPAHHLLGMVAVDVFLIIAGSAGMVQAALALGDRLHISRVVLGTLVLAPLTSLPNAVTGVRLGLAGRGAALVGETFNSNTINLGGGIIAPALFAGVAALGTAARVQLAWLVAMTLSAIVLLVPRRGLGRTGGVTLILMYACFAGAQLIG